MISIIHLKKLQSPVQKTGGGEDYQKQNIILLSVELQKELHHFLFYQKLIVNKN